MVTTMKTTVGITVGAINDLILGDVKQISRLSAHKSHTLLCRGAVRRSHTHRKLTEWEDFLLNGGDKCKHSRMFTKLLNATAIKCEGARVVRSETFLLNMR